MLRTGGCVCVKNTHNLSQKVAGLALRCYYGQGSQECVGGCRRGRADAETNGGQKRQHASREEEGGLRLLTRQIERQSRSSWGFRSRVE